MKPLTNPEVLVKLSRPDFSQQINAHDAFFEVIGDTNEARLRLALPPSLELRVWPDARLGDAIVQVRSASDCARERIRTLLERAGLTVLASRCVKAA